MSFRQRLIDRVGDVNWAEVYNFISNEGPRLYGILRTVGFRDFAESVVALGIHELIGVSKMYLVNFALDVLSDDYGEKSIDALLGKKRKTLHEEAGPEESKFDDLPEKMDVEYNGNWVLSGDLSQVTVESPGSAVINPAARMSAYTSYPLTRCCVDLGAFHPERKNDYVDPNYLADSVAYKYTMSGFQVSNQNKFTFLPLTDMRGTTAAGAFAQLVYGTQKQFPGFNSVRQLAAIFTQEGLTPPTYDNDPQRFISEPGDSQQLAVLYNQSITCHIKNLHFTESSAQESPIFIRIYLCQAKNDIYHEDPTDSAAEPISDGIKNGWERAYAGDLAGTNGEVDLHYRISENQYFLENWKIIDSKKFCLAPGQEGIFRAVLKQPQILSFQHMARATKYANTHLTPVVYKRGEQTFFIYMHGGITPYDNYTSMNVEKARLGFYAYSSWDAALYTPQKNQAVGVEVTEVANGTLQDADIDVHMNNP